MLQHLVCKPKTVFTKFTTYKESSKSLSWDKYCLGFPLRRINVLVRMCFMRLHTIPKAVTIFICFIVRVVGGLCQPVLQNNVILHTPWALNLVLLSNSCFNMLLWRAAILRTYNANKQSLSPTLNWYRQTKFIYMVSDIKQFYIRLAYSTPSVCLCHK